MNRILRVALLTAFAAVLMVAAADAQSRGLGRIVGTVVDDAGQPIEGVSVKVQFGDGGVGESKSDDKGRWQIAGVGRGEFVTDFTKVGFAPKKAKLIVEKELMRSEPVKITMKKL